jgi:transposase-like protein
MAVARMRSSTNIYELAKELGVNRSLLYRWKGQLEATPTDETAEGHGRRKIRGTPDSEMRIVN